MSNVLMKDSSVAVFLTTRNDHSKSPDCFSCGFDEATLCIILSFKINYDVFFPFRRRYVYVFQCASGPGFGMPMLVDTSGLFVRREGLGGLYVCSVSPTQVDFTLF